MQLSLIFAMDENNAIGKDNKLPWHLPADLKHFKQVTMNHTIIMGRNTFESIGRALPGRTNIVISRNPNYMLPPYITSAPSLATALQAAASRNEEEAIIIGGAQLFKEALPRAEKFYLTRIHHTFDADVFLPAINMDDWNILSQEAHQADEKNAYAYTFYTLERKKPEPAPAPAP